MARTLLIAGSTALHYVLFALPTVTSRRLSGAISFRPKVRPVACDARPWQSSPKPSAHAMAATLVGRRPGSAASHVWY
jgi:hypothetical protein